MLAQEERVEETARQLDWLSVENNSWEDTATDLLLKSETSARESSTERVDPVIEDTVPLVEDDTREHVNVTFFGHVGKSHHSNDTIFLNLVQRCWQINNMRKHFIPVWGSFRARQTKVCERSIRQGDGQLDVGLHDGHQ